MYYNDNTTLFLNGEWLKATNAFGSLYSQTLHYGNGVFEGIRAYTTSDGTRVFKAREHFERLQKSAELMHLPFNWSVEELTQLTYELLERNQLTDAYIRPLVYAGEQMKLGVSSESNLMLAAWEWPKLLGDGLLRIMTSSYERPNPKSCHVEAKATGHYTNSLLATTEATSKGYDEALLFDMNGNVAEAPGANFFLEKNGILYTPPLGNILAGITRNTVIGLARELGFEVREEHFSKALLHTADGAFLTGTAVEVAGIASIDDVPLYLDWEDTMGYDLGRMYRQRVSQNEYLEFSLV